MTLTIDLTSEQAARLQTEAESKGMLLQDYALRRLVGRGKQSRNQTGKNQVTARELLAMSPEERRPYLMAAAEAAAPLYEADLALPPAERELTAFTALDGEPFHEYE